MKPGRVVIVGGGPAGLSTALFLVHTDPAFRGRVIVLEKETYPREKFCAGAVGARAERLLGSIGVTIDVPSVPVAAIAFRALGETMTVREPHAGRVVRRIEFDHALSLVARSRGVDIREGVRVEGVRAGASDVVITTNQGELRADAVVGADGAGSVVRRSLGVPATPYWAQAIEVDTEPLPDDLPRDVLLFDVLDRSLPGYYWDFPTVVAGRPMVCRGVYYLKSVSEHPVEIRDVLARRLADRGLRLEDYRIKRFAERGFHKASALGVRRVLLAGEAAGIDPVTGEGIAQAIQYGAVAGRYLARKLRRGDDDFSDFRREVASTMIGRDLLVRTAAAPLFYGPRRPHVERFLLDTPDFIRVGLQHFAGRPWSRGAVVRGALRAVGAAARALAAP